MKILVVDFNTDFNLIVDWDYPILPNPDELVNSKCFLNCNSGSFKHDEEYVVKWRGFVHNEIFGIMCELILKIEL